MIRNFVYALPFVCMAYFAKADTAIRQVPQDTAQIVLSFAETVAASSPAVVNIYAKRRAKSSFSLFEDPFFKNFFPEFNFQTKRQENSLGSGVIIDSSGLIVSNLHVLQGAEDIVVVTHDRREYQADIVVEDDKTDLAVIKLKDFSGTLPSLPFGDVYTLQVGDLVLAIGNPFGVSQTVTSGIVSGLSRTLGNGNRYQSFIQTDAAINPGNSGGALIDSRGHLIGINSAIISPTGSSNGIGFAIPVNMIKPIVFAAKNDVPLNRAWLGFVPQAVDSDSAEALGLHYPHGVLVGNILAGSPADQAGLKTGDLIIAANDNLLDTPNNLRFFIATLIPEQTPTVRLKLHGQKDDITFPIAFPPAEPPIDRRVIAGRGILAHTAVVNISPFITEYYDLPLGSQGVMIQEILRGSPAHQLGFRAGDIILSLNDQSVPDVAYLVQLMDQSRPKKWDIVVQRAGKKEQWTLR